MTTPITKEPLYAEVHNVPDDYHFTEEEPDRIIAGDMFTPRQDAIMARELQERRKAEAEPAAYLVCNGRLYQDRPFLSLSAARQSVKDRNDGAEIKMLCIGETLPEESE